MSMLSDIQNRAIEEILDADPYLGPYRHDLELRLQNYARTKKTLLGDSHASLSSFANAHHHFGFHRVERDGRPGWAYREWAPGAKALFLIGDFNDWNSGSHPLARSGNGTWELWIGDDAPQKPEHGQALKVRVISEGSERDRIPLYIHRTRQDPRTHDFCGLLWDPPSPYRWNVSNFTLPEDFSPLIYEAHVGMAQERDGIGTYREFAENILPRIKEAGYNAVQLMGIMEHPYYGSFGYQVSNFYAASSRFGEPDDLKYLIDRAHEMGIAVLMDLVHSHAVKNINEGINEFDGTDFQFFHSGEKSDHPDWDTRVFNYEKPEVLHFLLSNLKYWLEEYRFDGFRFDGVTSMLYHNRGRDSFMSYDQYFSMNLDTAAVSYLQLANELIYEIRPDALVVAEDMSGMPGMARPLKEGAGIGFSARLGMGIPDLWIKLMEIRDEDWSIDWIWRELTNRRTGEKTIAYAESHDQALVGDKTISHWLMDEAIYHHMQKDDPHPVIARGIALHKLIRMITMLLGGEGYLNFMGNEFGHPEWIDFPREANQWSYYYARRQWNLADDPNLKYEYLKLFDRELVSFVRTHRLLRAANPIQLFVDEARKILAFEKGGFVFLFNFHPQESYPGLELPVRTAGEYRETFHTDRKEFGGGEHIERDRTYTAKPSGLTHFGHSVEIYSPSRTALVLSMPG